MARYPSRWIARPYPTAAARLLERELGVSSTVAAILARRGHTDAQAAERFLAGDERHDPALLPGAAAAAETLVRHAAAGSRIAVFGDYDVDGVCSTAVLLRALRALGADPRWRLPSRFEDGYGLSVAGVDRLADEGTALLVTVDCGITAVAEVQRAAERGIEVVVCDHHRPGDRLPDCTVVHPAIPTSAGTGGGYPFPDLCATAVAYKLAQVLLARAGLDPAAADGDLDLVGLATVCDLVPLHGENRRLAREGLAALSRTRRPGLRALMRVAGVDPGDADEHTAGFRLGPRLNAAGRMSRADAALELLTTDDDARAAQVADELDLLNRDRREAETRMLFQAEAACAPQAHRAAIVVAGEGWHQGVAGIVASRLVERWRRPCVVIALDGESGRGSGRSISAYDLHAGLSACAAQLTRFGGHRMAAGVEVAADAVPAFADALAAHAGQQLTPADLIPVERVDAVVPAGALGHPLAEELERLGPFGAGNPRPTLVVPAARVAGASPMGEERQHARFMLVGGGARARGVAFGRSAGSLAQAVDEPHDIALRLERNRWNGAVEVRAVLRALCATRSGPVEVVGAESTWDAVERELAAPPDSWWPPPGPPCRELCDCRGEGFAGVAGELLSSGEGVLVVCAEPWRRAAALGPIIGGYGRVAATSWEAIACEPALAEGFEHVVALDPPPDDHGEALLAAAGGQGAAHMAWGAGEAQFALAAWRAELDLDAALPAVYRALRDHDAARPGSLDAALRGGGVHPRPASLRGRLLRVLSELGLIEWVTVAEGGPACRVLDAPRTSLDLSPTVRACRERLAAVQRRLAPAERALPLTAG